MGILQKVSSGHMKYILKGIQCMCFQVMSLLTGPGIGPPMYGRRGNRDGDKILCNMYFVYVYECILYVCLNLCVLYLYMYYLLVDI